MAVCYFCGKKLITPTKEHVPPKCFFPDDSRNNNLITVKSCDEHNNQKSGADEYMLQPFAGIYDHNNKDSNGAYLLDKATKSLIKASTKKSVKTVDDILSKNHKDPRLVYNIRNNGLVAESRSVEVDDERVISFLEAVSRGVLHKKSKVTWKGKVSVYPHFLISNKSPKNLQHFSKGLLNFLNEKDATGEVKDIFYYQITAFPGGGYSVGMCFFRQFKATCTFE